ncbi:prephenate dehydrogenase [Clostridium thermopalmarium]|uniref:Prephenate dehydrogenase n=1 Tax=Clostridium thermopalmarium DSM 5974 TaxID=1121340 RepID=A0A2T0AS20_9CLOT|nr:prephenate dehydrogenase [Clostridium thermopalmarium]PRR72865.1 prephenate dehydrogenase [Clostridium thermopalmarium DSM 5974]PVZ21110.1 prephenate dehydrogenase [Clostridium thermopalmarium DSM 5974]
MGLDLNITIVGLGLIGGSYALALRELNPKKLYAVDIDEDTIKLGEERGIIDKGFLSPEIPLKESDLVIVCIYPKSIKKFIKDNMDNFKSGAVITDTVGIKKDFAQDINSILREDIDFIFGHPMAGREFTGLGYASKEIFKGANYIIIPTERNKKENIRLIENIAKDMGFKHIEKVSVEKHDEAIGFVSQLPHVIAVSLVNSDNLEVDTGKFTGDSYRDLTRIARINTKLWTELFIGNRKNLINHIERFEKNIADIKHALINEDTEALGNILNRASKKREEMS